MCYGCLSRVLVETVELALEEARTAKIPQPRHASEHLMELYQRVVMYWKSGSTEWRRTMAHHSNPLVFSCAVIVRQLHQSLYTVPENSKKAGGALTPLSATQILTNVRKLVKCMNTVSDHNPYGDATMGVEEMGPYLARVNDLLSS
jgi:hypothetical protein